MLKLYFAECRHTVRAPSQCYGCLLQGYLSYPGREEVVVCEERLWTAPEPHPQGPCQPPSPTSSWQHLGSHTVLFGHLEYELLQQEVLGPSFRMGNNVLCLCLPRQMSQVVQHLLVYAQYIQAESQCQESLFVLSPGGPWKASSGPLCLNNTEPLPGPSWPQLAGMGFFAVPSPAQGLSDSCPGTALNDSEHTGMPRHMDWEESLSAIDSMMQIQVLSSSWPLSDGYVRLISILFTAWCPDLSSRCSLIHKGDPQEPSPL